MWTVVVVVPSKKVLYDDFKGCLGFSDARSISRHVFMVWLQGSIFGGRHWFHLRSQSSKYNITLSHLTFAVKKIRPSPIALYTTIFQVLFEPKAKGPKLPQSEENNF